MNKSLLSVSVVVAGLAAAALPAQPAPTQPAPTQPAAANPTQFARDVAFVRDLVRDLRFVELAEHELRRLRDRHRGDALTRQLDELAVDVAIQSARVHPDRREQRRLFEQAFTRAQRLVAVDGDGAAGIEAWRGLVECCLEYGQFLQDEIEVREDAGTPTGELRKAAGEVYRKGTAAARALQEACVAAGKDIDGLLAWMHRGILLREHARMVPADRPYLAAHAVDTLEELILEVGEETALGQRALFERAKVAEVLGSPAEAARSYADTIDAIWIALTDEDAGILPAPVEQMMLEMMQEVYGDLARVRLQVAGGPGSGPGSAEAIGKLVAQCHARLAEFEAEPHPIHGDVLRLTHARALARARRAVDVESALKIAREVNDRHPFDFIGQRAKRLIRDLLAGSSELVSGALLFEVAKGEFLSKRDDAAIAGAKRALRRMEPATRQELGFAAWTLLARAEERLQRPLEAAMAYCRALELHGADEPEDELRRTAQRAASCVRRATANAGGSGAFTALRVRVEQQLRRYSPGFAVAKDYDRALDLKARREYGEAARVFLSIPPSFEKYEMAQGQAVMCLYHGDRFDAAMQQIAALREYASSHPLADDDRAGRARRAQALAWAHYAEGRVGYARYQEEEDPAAARTLLAHFETFESVHAGHAANLLPVVQEIAGRLQVSLGELDAAQARYDALRAGGAESADAHRGLGLTLFGALIDRAEAAAAAAVATEDADGSDERRATAARGRALEFGLGLARSIAAPPYALLYNLMRQAEALGRWKDCEWAAERLLAEFGTSKRRSLAQVRPTLGLALMRQSGRLREALDVLTAAERQWDDGRAKTSAYYEVLRYKAEVLGGWPEFDADGVNYVPKAGLGRPAEAYDILWNGDYRKFALHSSRARRYSLDWYRYHLQLYFVCKQAEKQDPRFEQRADTLYGIARATDDFATLKRLGAEGRRVALLFQYVRRAR